MPLQRPENLIPVSQLESQVSLHQPNQERTYNSILSPSTISTTNLGRESYEKEDFTVVPATKKIALDKLPAKVDYTPHLAKTLSTFGNSGGCF